MNGIKQYEKKLNSLIARRKILREQRAGARAKAKQCSKDIVRAIAAREIIQRATTLTQQKLAENVSGITSLVLCTVLPDNYEFKANFVSKRNSTECEFQLFKNGKERHPLDNVGGGVGDLESFGLRMSFWSMYPNRPVMVLDEPFKCLDIDAQEKASEMLKMLSKELGIQIIMVSHLPNIIGSADKVFRVYTKNDISMVEEK